MNQEISPTGIEDPKNYSKLNKPTKKPTNQLYL
jgi:hypothetical protein